MIPRLLNIPKNYSFFLFGPRGVGKTTLLKCQLPEESTFTIDLLDFETENRFALRPKEFSEVLDALPSSTKWIFIDEIQKLPRLLDEVHRYIEKYPHRHFALTGSSARKLKRGQANLLAGRAFTYKMSALTSVELDKAFNLEQALAFGTLPKIFNINAEEDKKIYLRTYANTYLREEIQSEGIVRNLQGFRRFLPLAASENGQILSWSNIAQDTGLDAKTVRSYFEILEDTLIGFFLPAYHRSIRKRQKTHPKFYLFDTGVARALAGKLNVPLIPGTTEYERAFEHFWITEIIRVSEYKQSDYAFSYLATSDMEIDLVVERPARPLLFIEIKSGEHIKDRELRALRSLVTDVKDSEGVCICREPVKRKSGNVLICPWQEALTVVE